MNVDANRGSAYYRLLRYSRYACVYMQLMRFCHIMLPVVYFSEINEFQNIEVINI